MKQYIIFRLAGESYAASISQVSSIVDVNALSLVPNAPDYVAGLMNLRGEVLPIISLKKRFGLEEDQQSRRILIAQIGAQRVGYMVDDASQSMSKEDHEVFPAPEIAFRSGNSYVAEVAVDNNRLVLVIDLQQVISESEIQTLTERISS